MAAYKKEACRRAKLFLRELVKFVLKEREIPVNILGDNALKDAEGEVFNEAAGKIVVAYAKTKVKPYLILSEELFINIDSKDRYSSYWSNVRHRFFRQLGFDRETIYLFLAYAIECSILFYKRGFQDAPKIVVKELAKTLGDILGGQFVMDGELDRMNEDATEMLEMNDELDKAYGVGQFAW